MKHRFIRRLLSAAAAGALLLTGIPAVPASVPMEAQAATLCTIDTTKTYQSVRGFGGINLPEWISQGDMTDAQVQKAFGNGEDELGLTILRIYVSDDSNSWRIAVPTAKRAQALGATVFATPWNPPASIRKNGNGDIYSGKYQLDLSKQKEYAQHLNSYVKYMEGQGIDLYAISVQNEPDYAAEWTYWSANDLASFIANYGKDVTAGTNAKLMSPESFQYRKDIYTPILNNAQAFANTDLFGTHFYGTQRSQMDYPALENSGKEIWMTEVYVPNSEADSANRWPEAVSVAENIHNGLVVGNLNAYVWWYIRRSYGLLTEDGKISKRGYCMAQYSKFVRPGSVRLDVTEQPESGVYVSAYRTPSNQVAVVAVNNSDNGYAQQFSINGQISNVDRWRTTGDENLAKTLDLEHESSTFWAQLPARSVSTFVITLDGDVVIEPTQPTEPGPDDNGFYFHDTFEDSVDSWEGHGAADVTQSGRTPMEGTNALLAQNRTGTWNGAQKVLDTRTFKAGTAYSFSACACFLEGGIHQDFKLTMQYTDANGETKFAGIDEQTALRGQYVQLSNERFTIPEGASDVMIYVENPSGTGNFYIDEVYGAVAGTAIEGPAAQTWLKGDLNRDGVINVIDLALAKRGLTTGFGNILTEAALDVNDSNEATLTDAIALQKFIIREIDAFEAGEDTVTDTPVQSGDQNQEDTPVTAMSMSEFTAQCAPKVIESEPYDSHNEVAGRAYGTIQSGTYYSTTCGREKPYNILLPAGYTESKQYPVLYVMHGYWENQDRMIIQGNGTMYTRQIIGNAIAEGAAKDMIVVFPYIYSSATQPDCTAMDDANNAAYDNFINDLTKDLMPHIESTYSVKTGRENTAITGFSMGGRESLLIGMQRSDLFGYVGAICPAPGVTGAFKWESGKEPYLLMITAGSNDTVVYNNPENYHNSFTQNGVPHIWHYVNGGYHGDNSIQAHLYNFCRFAFQAA
ncbi:MAG: carbohydrate binding domain-containing protein [Oscillospiraceae bacterium]|nr:carbohydrate binding domain-containing protein [Oscillospiraceae bacterium]